MTGTDPFDVWSGKIEKEPFIAYGKPNDPAGIYREAVNAYPPWAYGFVLPIAGLPLYWCWIFYFLCMAAFLAMFGWFGWRIGRAEFSDKWDARLVSVMPLLVLVFAIASNVRTGNYAVHVLAAVVLMAWALDRGRDALAGVCWAAAMVKPQLGLIFAVPLLMRRKIKTCATAVAVCLAASVPAVMLSDKNLFVLTRESIDGSMAFFCGCGTMPYLLAERLPQQVAVMLALVVGAAFCVLMTRLVSRNASWLETLMPAALCGTLWSYSQLYCTVVIWPYFVMLAVSLLKNPKSVALRVIAVFSCIFLSRIYTFYHGFMLDYGKVFGLPYFDLKLHGHLDSLNSAGGLLSALAFCVWKYLHPQDGNTGAMTKCGL
jgi:hypothetical protein